MDSYSKFLSDHIDSKNLQPLVVVEMFARLAGEGNGNRENRELLDVLYRDPRYSTEYPAMGNLINEKFYKDFYSEFLSKMGEDAKREFDLEWFARSMGKIALNAFTPNLMNEKGEDRGTFLGLYILTSMFNHSCSPNVNWESYRGTNSLEVTTIKDIEMDEELFISYVDPELSFQERRKKLLNSYGFECRCAKCQNQAPLK
eukprot:TRINITY_DN5781_c0_g2_i1.p1 TRINITY_DN5781_c0_g2~~TRINITY_DN5781_c0_g2_i1.p1  ORF type:complete len:233 (-),score=63.16 TRINITY_DN5781_c0_g2_i1:243-845(-)